ncbi:MAG: hypothetical protein KF900_04590 [Bacteroidetes bacterium]|nr:hypothetical protein [Bacteroidota bacterium]
MLTKPEHIKKAGIVCLLILMPSLAHAELNISTADVVLIGAMFLIPIIIAIIGLISAFVYLKKETRRAFYFSVIPAAILLLAVVLSYGVQINKLLSLFGGAWGTFISLSILIIFTVVSYKKIKNNPPQAFWFYVISTTSVMLFSRLILLLLFPMLNHLIKSPTFVFAIWVLNGLIFAFIYGLYSFIYVHKTLQNNQTIENKKLFLNTGLISILSFLTLHFLGLLSINQTDFKTDFAEFFLNPQLLIGLLIVMAVSALATFVALKKYRRSFLSEDN